MARWTVHVWQKGVEWYWQQVNREGKGVRGHFGGYNTLGLAKGAAKRSIPNTVGGKTDPKDFDFIQVEGPPEYAGPSWAREALPKTRQAAPAEEVHRLPTGVEALTIPVDLGPQPEPQYDIDAASRKLWNIGLHHGWWNHATHKETRSYEEAYADDPIGKSEFEGIVEDILKAGMGR